MRKITLQMMTTLNGRLDEPFAWCGAVHEDLYAEIDRHYATYDTVLVGRATYDEMFAYWPGAEHDPAGTDTNRRMAHRMNTYRKVVFSRSPQEGALKWAHAEWASAPGDVELMRRVEQLKNEPGAGIHLAGGARLARSFHRLGLIDEYRFFVHPVVSAGLSWFGELGPVRSLELVDTKTFAGGVVEMHYRPKPAEAPFTPPPARFTELLR